MHALNKHTASARVAIAPSILSADAACLGEEVARMDAAGADYIHIDVMDGHFVPNITMGPHIVKALRRFSKKPFDVHLMIAPVDPYIEAFAEAGADIISVHPEAGPHVHRTLQSIRAKGCRAGLVLNPGTSVDVLNPLLDAVDLVLVMTVNPGFGGQAFLDAQIEKIAACAQRIHESGRDIALEVDGGIDANSAPKAVAAGARILVAGSAAFKGGETQYAENIATLRAAGEIK